MHRRNDTFLEIVPHYSDPDTYVTYTVSNGGCRTSLQIYADLYELASVAATLRGGDSEEMPFVPSERISLDLRFCMNIAFSVYSRQGKGKILRVVIVNDADVDQGYRSETDIVLTYEEANELATELEKWLKNPICHFIWKP